MDVALAGIDGIEAARRIRALPGAAGHIPIIGVSGRSERRRGRGNARPAWTSICASRRRPPS